MRPWRFLSKVGVLGAVAAALHCGSSSESSFSENGSGPCQTIYAGKCGLPCTTDAECADGLYCGSNKLCTADCGPGYTCANGEACTARGRCGDAFVPSSFGDGGTSDPGSDASDVSDAICADTTVTLTKILPKVVFLLDQSSSMWRTKFPDGDSNECAAGCRWTVLKDVLIGPNNAQGGLVKQLEGQAELAVEMYSATDSKLGDGDDSYLTGAVDNVCPRFNGKAFDGLSFSTTPFASVNAQLRGATVDDDTPTGPAIRSVVGLSSDGGIGNDGGFAALTSTAPKVLVLVTDGEPGNCGDNFTSDSAKAAVVTAVQQTYRQNIRTFVIAIGADGSATHFKNLANAGQGLDPTSGDAGAILPGSPDQLLQALRSIVLGARTCVFDLNGQVQPNKERLGTVTLNGATVPFDEPGAPDEGWRLVNPSRIELVGAACATVKSEPDAVLSARFPCGSVIPGPGPIR